MFIESLVQAEVAVGLSEFLTFGGTTRGREGIEF